MTTERIDYARQARASLSDAYRHREAATVHAQRNDISGARHFDNVASADLACAQVEATLALVEQQRVANLIACLASAARAVEAGSGTLEGYLHMYDLMNPEIEKGLSL